MSTAKAILLKEDGNRRFQAGDYVSAEALYSKAYVFVVFCPSPLPSRP